MTEDPTKIDIASDPTVQRMTGITVHGSIPFDVPFISEIAPDLWQGGCQNGLVLPPFIKHLVSLLPCGARLGRGVSTTFKGGAPPPPRPSPIKGEGENF